MVVFRSFPFSNQISSVKKFEKKAIEHKTKQCLKFDLNKKVGKKKQKFIDFHLRKKNAIY